MGSPENILVENTFFVDNSKKSRDTEKRNKKKIDFKHPLSPKHLNLMVPYGICSKQIRKFKEKLNELPRNNKVTLARVPGYVGIHAKECFLNLLKTLSNLSKEMRLEVL